MHSLATQKSQGLSFNTIVLAIIALIILVIIVLFVTGGAAKFMKGFRTTETTDVEDAKNQCRLLCSRAQTNVENINDFKSSPYCTKAFRMDLDPSTQGITAGSWEENVQCWERGINVDCSISIIQSGSVPICRDTTNCRPKVGANTCESINDAATCTADTYKTDANGCPNGCKGDPEGNGCVRMEDADCTAAVAAGQTKILTGSAPETIDNGCPRILPEP